MKFSKEIKADAASYEMANYEAIAEHMAERLKDNKIAELCCGVGITAIQLAKFSEVVGVDINKEYIENAKYNAKLYGVNMNFIVGDVLDINLLKKIKANIIVLDPDWSSGDDKSLHVANISETKPALDKLYNLAKKNTKNICFRFPGTMDVDQIRKLGNCEIENIFLENKFKFNIAYFGDLKKEDNTEVRL